MQGEPNGAVVVAHDVARRYGVGDTAVDALRGVSLEVGRGKLTAVMGPSGSGKSTLMHILAGLDKPSSGTVSVSGTEITNLKDSDLTKLRRRHIGFVFQMYNLLPVLTAARNVELPLLLTRLGSADRKRRVQVALNVVGLGERANHYPRQLSGGQEQRVGIARAIVTDPTLLLAGLLLGKLLLGVVFDSRRDSRAAHYAQS